MNIDSLKIDPSEFLRCAEELDRLLERGIKTPGHLMSLDKEKLTYVTDQYLTLNTENYWGFFKLLTKNPISYTLSRTDAIKLRSAIDFRIERNVTKALEISTSWLKRSPMFYL